MANPEQMRNVANRCPGYNAVPSAFESNAIGASRISCGNCEHWENDRCVIDLFDKVLPTVHP